MTKSKVKKTTNRHKPQAQPSPRDLMPINDNMTVTVHWAGKFRGPNFAPMNFQLKTCTSEKLKTAKGKSM
jgi:hypothetical protein